MNPRVAVLGPLLLILPAQAARRAPESPGCREAFAIMRQHSDLAPDAAAWDAWQEYLLSLGYDESAARNLISEMKWPIDQVRDQVRDVIGRKDWSWSDDLNRAESARLGKFPYGEIPFEYLGATKGFDPAAAIEARLNARGFDEFSELRWLVRRGCFWAKDRPDLAAAFIRHLARPEFRNFAQRALGKLFDRAQRLAIARSVAEAHPPTDVSLEKIFATTDLRPRDTLPAATAEEIADRYPSGESRFTSDSVEIIPCGLADAGTCEEMTFRHLRLLFDPEDPALRGVDSVPRPLVIRIDGRVVGLLKNEEDPTMLALENVFEREGDQILTKGGVYRVTRALAAEPGRKISWRDWRGVDLDKLRVQPLGPVLGPQGWNARNAFLLAALMDGPAERAEALILEEIVASYDHNVGDLGYLRAQHHRGVWGQVLRRIDRLREILNRSFD